MITINITNGPTFAVAYTAGMNAQQALENAYQSSTPGTFTYGLQYYGDLGYLVMMINETYETFNSKECPFYFWEFLVNDKVSSTGIDYTKLNDEDRVTFTFLAYTVETPNESTLHAKYQSKI